MDLALSWLVLALTGVAVVRGAAHRRALVALVVTAACAAIAAAQLGYRAAVGRRAAPREALAATTPRVGRPGGYVSSATCRACHPSEHDSWHRSFHRTMTQLATPEAVRGPFDGVRLELDGRAYLLEREGDAFFVREGDAPRRRVEMVTGSHAMQAFWSYAGHGNAQLELPFTYLIGDRRWVPRRDTFLMSPEMDKAASTWNRTCIECHATAGQPRYDASRAPETRVAELGIACEACHGPAQAHVEANENPLRRAWLRVTGARDTTIVDPARLPARRSAEVCGQCHGVACTLEGFRTTGLTYRPGEELEAKKPLIRPRDAATSACNAVIEREGAFLESRFWSDGVVRVSGREYNGLSESACFRGGELACVSCHSMHRADPDDQLAPGKEGDGACAGCHAEIAARGEAHTHHGSGSTGAACMNCHMPYTTYGLLKAIRSHRIDSPSVANTLDTGRPNACNLCHLDRSLGWTAERLEAWYGIEAPELDADDRTIPASLIEALRGDAGQRALAAWAMGWAPAQAASGADWIAPYLAELLDDRYAAVRYVAARSLKSLPGFADFRFDYVAPAAELEAARELAIERWRRTPTKRAEPIDGATRARLVEERDDPNMVLAE